jgi:hypothetical protein
MISLLSTLRWGSNPTPVFSFSVPEKLEQNPKSSLDKEDYTISRGRKVTA